ncbi:T9SS type B sorting domain-containing protein [Phaeodactylibacter luteus]|uniref:Gliding motility-associated C-terminal domain-containing protein n=1 Tax=Phaeodactylibacter luteus TaxID=1564516 RepID=A0A5C6S2I8_9BACT|nr:gliding motility-associated C-terminal domain-containing protein [Phaeodactylibacter luteus]TXB68829.1 gliding motility-associated C-terminal domain-containing protein [Phaeodactylibacter luteus]
MKYWFSFFWALLPLLAGAQLCEGIPGAAAFTESFGQGSNFGPPLPAGVTTYSYNNTSPAGGTYMVTNRTQLNGASWHPGLDNTPDDGFGYMLLFDATDAPGEFFNLVLDGLCPGTRYEFSAYLANVVTPSACGGQSILPNVRFELRDPSTDALLSSIQTGPIPTGAFLRWEQYGMAFTLPPDQDAVRLLLINTAAGGCGNDVAIDDISLSICNPVRSQTATRCGSGPVVIDGREYAAPGLYRDTLPGAQFCNDSILLTEILDGAGEEVAIDTFICEGSTFSVGGKAYAEPGFYVDTLLSSLGCDSIVRAQLSPASLTAWLTASQDTVYAGEAVRLAGSAEGDGPLIWSWQPEGSVDCPDCPETDARPVQTTNYELTVRDSITGCQVRLQQLIEVVPCQAVYIPTAFSPNGDGRNDTFQLFYGPCVAQVLQLQVYHRWGGLVFQSQSGEEAWDGRSAGQDCEAGLYICQAVLLLKSGAQQIWRGEVQLLR